MQASFNMVRWLGRDFVLNAWLKYVHQAQTAIDQGIGSIILEPDEMARLATHYRDKEC
jgi:hypothetical protein